MEIQDIGSTDGSVTCKKVTYMPKNLARTDLLLLYCKTSFFFLVVDCFLQAVRLYPVTLVIVSPIRAACKLSVRYL